MENKNTFWQSERGKAIIKLGLWMIFIAILIAVVIFSDTSSEDIKLTPTEEETTNTETENYKFTNYNDMIDKLLLYNYEYTYTITTLDNKYIYTGWKNNNQELGFKEDASGIIKYFIDETGNYRINLDNRELITDLYSNFDASYLNLSMLFDNLSEYLYSVEKNADVRTITYDKEGYQVTVITDTENITNINITVDTTTYDLEFTKIGECATIVFTD